MCNNVFFRENGYNFFLQIDNLKTFKLYHIVDYKHFKPVYAILGFFSKTMIT